MNLTELSDLSRVIEHLKNVISTAGITRFTNVTLTSLKKQLGEFEELFISSILNYKDDNRNTAKIIQEAVQEARGKMGLDERYPTAANLSTKKRSRVEATIDTVEEPVSLQTTETAAIKTNSVESTPGADHLYLQDESLAEMLAAEKQKVAAKKRKSK